MVVEIDFQNRVRVQERIIGTVGAVVDRGGSQTFDDEATAGFDQVRFGAAGA
ncbi:hypothetical protein LP420_10605 [Massilia sp. B-10]|nr:hypothetical protein LP420_10605 [Massilia sp. B-10]